ncbi:MAG TPA: hypothetical protein VGV37_12620 [Aliidongia sp.]|uniref:hypothetical protein n=1 Tax=Aliidongia sp. TaxID=1914230 RepID=UPI002DDD1CC4|nr:hypothetical protein [Aliidongia sp.]HEV2675378.1 hypothetical protein [Aliidongia sp.]
MSKRIVLIPFPTDNSQEHLFSTKGGNILPETIQQEEDAARSLSETHRLVQKVESFPDSPKKQIVLSEIQGAHNINKENLRKARTNREESTKPGWRRIAATDIFCSNTVGLARVLADLFEADDVLYIRGHCAAGSPMLQSSDHEIDIAIPDIIALLANGLPKVYPGRIKLFACESALGLNAKESFAALFKKTLVNKGWVNARVVGYGESLNTFIVRADGHKSATDGTRAKDNKVYA